MEAVDVIFMQMGNKYRLNLFPRLKRIGDLLLNGGFARRRTTVVDDVHATVKLFCIKSTLSNG